MLVLIYRHGLREIEVYRQTGYALHLETGRIGVTLLKGSLSTDQPIKSNELRVRWLKTCGVETNERKQKIT